MKTKFFTILVMTAVVLSACSGGGNKRRARGSFLTPQSSGNPYEVMVVADDSVWQGYAGKAVQAILDKPLRGMPQDEEQFHKSHIEHKHFDKITNLFRNIIKINISDDYTMAKMRYQKDVYSTPQIIITVNAPDQISASTYITEHTKAIESLITSEEINREANDLVDSHNRKFEKEVKDMFDCTMYIPSSLKELKKGENFIWASDNGLSTIQNIVIYSLPYVSEKMFMKGPYCALRDTIMKRNIPGGHPGMWMQTNKDYVWTKNISVKGVYAMEARGLWEMRNDAMGGPFVSHSRIDSINGRIIVVEGFVYAPNKMKRTMLRRLEGALYTLETPAKPKEEKEEKEVK